MHDANKLVHEKNIHLKGIHYDKDYRQQAKHLEEMTKFLKEEKMFK